MKTYLNIITLILLNFSCALFATNNAEKWIVITTIQYPTEQVRELAKIPGWRVVVVGDKKTPKDWALENCDYLSPEKQQSLGYEISNLMPWNHYSRKNVGYLYAIENGATIIYDTDDDNKPIAGLNPCAIDSTLSSLITSENCVNVYSYFGQPEVWPRGLPLQKIATSKSFQIASPTVCKIGIEQGVVNESPDVDAIFRLTQDKVIDFTQQPPCFLPEGIFCPFNSQNTYIHKDSFYTLYIPSTVSMRVSDIWRGYIAQKLIWKFGYKLAFSGPSAIQHRNEHNLFHDYVLEQDLYLKAQPLLDFLSKWDDTQATEAFQLMRMLFGDLTEQKFFQEKELTLLEAWLRDLKRVGKKQ